MEKKKKKRRRYKLVIPGVTVPKSTANGAPVRKKKRRRRRLRLRREVYYVLAGIVVILLLILIPQAITNSKLKKLGYDKETIKAIKDQKLTKTLIDNQWYSAYLAQCIKDGTLNKDYMELYTVVDAQRGLDDTDFLIVGRLKDKGYEWDQILNLYHNLRDFEITPLLVYDYQPIEQDYINDCIAHSGNSPTLFELDGSYFEPYGNPASADPSVDSVLVNKTWNLESSYVPAGLRDLSVQAGAVGAQMKSSAADAIEAWAKAGQEEGVNFYATSAYRAYDSQKALYDNYVQAHGQEQADLESARPGFSEHQTGLCADVAETNNESADFSTTAAYRWATAHAADYGFILRYPKGKESITQYEFESWHFRFVTIPVAKAMAATDLTFDEFWSLYMKPWDSEDNKPSQEILDATDWQKLTQAPAEDQSAETKEEGKQEENAASAAPTATPAQETKEEEKN